MSHLLHAVVKFSITGPLWCLAQYQKGFEHFSIGRSLSSSYIEGMAGALKVLTYVFLFLICFVFSFSEELVALTTRFTDELMNQGLTKRILTLVSEINVTREFERLQKERGLGNEKHRKEVGANLLS